MCQHSLRTQIKPIWLRCIAGWEIFYWCCMGGLCYSWWYYLDRLNIRRTSIGGLNPGDILYQGAKQEYDAIIYDWDVGLWVHIWMCLGFVPISFIIFFAMHYKMKSLLMLYLGLSTFWAFFRIFWMFYYPEGFQFLHWYEAYWLVRIYFDLSIFNGYLDFVDREVDREQVELPLMIPLVEDTRDWRGGNMYPEFPMLLDPRPRHHGIGRFTLGPASYDPTEASLAYPTFFVTPDRYDGHDIVVVDEDADLPL